MIKRYTILFTFVIILLGCIGSFKYIHSVQVQANSLSDAYKVLKNRSLKINFAPNKGDAIGILAIPSLNSELPIVETNEKVERGVSHYIGSALPDEDNQMVLLGQDDPVFKRIDELKAGDNLVVSLPYGSFTYKIERIEVVEANNTSMLKSTSTQELLVLATNYLNDPKQYVIYATR